jgi:hypothetical protein
MAAQCARAARERRQRQRQRQAGQAAHGRQLQLCRAVEGAPVPAARPVRPGAEVVVGRRNAAHTTAPKGHGRPAGAARCAGPGSRHGRRHTTAHEGGCARVRSRPTVRPSYLPNHPRHPSTLRSQSRRERIIIVTTQHNGQRAELSRLPRM